MNQISGEEFLDNVNKLASYYQEILQYILEHKLPNYSFDSRELEKLQKVYLTMFEQALEHPEKTGKINFEYLNDFQHLISSSVNKFTSPDDESGKNNNKIDDRRFHDPAWGQNVYFDFIKQYYLLTSDWIKKSAKQYNLDADTAKYIKFSTDQFIDAVSPSNFAFSNPEVIQESIDTGMENLVKGMENFLKDIQKPDNIFSISTTDKAYFKIGKNLASTSGKVIYQNELMQLICYEPKEKTHSIPMLIVPPWINKYYILDLSEKNSLVKWLVDNNFQVFLISWVNPSKKLSHKGFENYLKEGILDATEQINKLGYKKINIMGYCIGGTLLASALSYLKENKKDYFHSATFLTTLIDFAKPGEIGSFITDSFIDLIKEKINEVGYLDGKYLSNSFSLIRANDLIWSFFVNNYLLGKSPAAFDILYWNSDSTNLPSSMYLYYLRNMYVENNLKKPGKLTMLDTKIDVTNIDLPTFSVAAKKDHIALWDAVYDGYKLLKGDKTFCLTEAGHVAGVVNPVENNKYSHMMGKQDSSTSKEWLKNAKKHKGSWWSSWHKWLLPRSGKLVASLKYDNLKSIEPAPGKYVRK